MKQKLDELIKDMITTAVDERLRDPLDVPMPANTDANGTPSLSDLLRSVMACR